MQNLVTYITIMLWYSCFTHICLLRQRWILNLTRGELHEHFTITLSPKQSTNESKG